MKKRILSIVCLICTFSVFLSSLTATAVSPSIDKPVGKMSAVYGYVLNNYIAAYGAFATDTPGEVIYGENNGYVSPTGVVYADVINFDANENPYLVIFMTEGQYSAASCHIWRFNEETEEAERVAVLAKNYSELPYGWNGEYNVGWNGEKRYLSYKEYSYNNEVSAEYYTVVDGDAFIYVNNPENITEVGVMDFNGYYFHSGVDVSKYNKELTKFFDSLKNAAADSVTYRDIAERLNDEDEAQIEAVLSEAVKYDYFDIASYSSFVRYEAALDSLKTNTDKFYLISNMYNLGDEIYYVRFSTDKSYYNYALLRRSPEAENGYQILKVCTECIPLSDIELKAAQEEYKRNILLYKKAKGTLRLTNENKYFSDEPLTQNSEIAQTKESKIEINKVLSRRMRLPAACVGGGISIALLTALWLYISSDDE